MASAVISLIASIDALAAAASLPAEEGREGLRPFACIYMQHKALMRPDSTEHIVRNTLSVAH